MRPKICCNCKTYPCLKTKALEGFLKEYSVSIRLSYNGCKDFIEA